MNKRKKIFNKRKSLFLLIIYLSLGACQPDIVKEEQGSLIDETQLNLSTKASLFSTPKPRLYHAMAYDNDRQVIVLFGGKDDGVLDDTWEYDGINWYKINTPESPPGRVRHSMVYDPSRKTVILFGGSTKDEEYTNDTWEYNGTTWIQLETPPELLPRHFAAMVYDFKGERIILFGGGYEYGPLWDTWQYDGLEWQELSIEPPVTGYGAALAQMVYDSNLEKSVLQTILDNTYIFDGKEWTNKASLKHEDGSNAGVLEFRMAYDTQRQVTVLFNGGSSNDTWEFDGNNWHYINLPESPSARLNHSMVYDENRQVIVLFGGLSVDDIDDIEVLNDTWEYDGVSWTQR